MGIMVLTFYKLSVKQRSTDRGKICKTQLEHITALHFAQNYIWISLLDGWSCWIITIFKALFEYTCTKLNEITLSESFNHLKWHTFFFPFSGKRIYMQNDLSGSQKWN